MDGQNWDTGEAMLWLDNEEYSYKAAMRLVSDGLQKRQTKLDGLRAIFGEVYVLDLPEGEGVDADKVNWDAIHDRIADDIAENLAYEEANS